MGPIKLCLSFDHKSECAACSTPTYPWCFWASRFRLSTALTVFLLVLGDPFTFLNICLKKNKHFYRIHLTWHSLTGWETCVFPPPPPAVEVARWLWSPLLLSLLHRQKWEACRKTPSSFSYFHHAFELIREKGLWFISFFLQFLSHLLAKRCQGVDVEHTGTCSFQKVLAYIGETYGNHQSQWTMWPGSFCQIDTQPHWMREATGNSSFPVSWHLHPPDITAWYGGGKCQGRRFSDVNQSRDAPTIVMYVSLESYCTTVWAREWPRFDFSKVSEVVSN